MILKVSSRIKHQKRLQGKIQGAEGCGFGMAFCLMMIGPPFASGPGGSAALRFFS